MFEMVEDLYICAMVHINHFIEDEKGAVDMVTVVVLVAIVLGLAVIFKKRIEGVLTTMFTNIEKNADKVTK